MARYWWKRLIVAVVVLLLLVWGYDRVQMIHWVGSTDLEVEFVVTDSATGDPVSGARIEVQSDGGFYEERDKQQFTLNATDGVARKTCRNSMCFGTQSGLRFTDTFVVHLPFWRFRVLADGFEPDEWTELDVSKYIRQVREAGPGKAKLVVRVSLNKTHAGGI